ncbi:phosphatase PAP2 family protein [Microbacterium sp. STN6]|uniref:phosphatase PAP2 family protein n=1 Tax=Microbacterium sp. STN6 TaxID=2995588 RepID=UPI002260CE2A|nr:phosphatase PAP2 family protein [Microbacterium sp. STN6]MCX7522911.1 phosphatase PAP2 family protein [Microbacterium sp. STN6]
MTTGSHPTDDDPAAVLLQRPRRIDPIRPLSRPLLTGGLGVAGLLLVVIAGLVLAHAPGWSSRELVVLQWLSGHHAPALDGIALGIAWLFSPPLAATITVLGGGVVVIVTRNLWRTVTFMLIVAASWGGSEVVKWIAQRPRPDGSLLAHPLAVEHSLSYPSGHTCFAAALAIAVVFTLRDSRWRTLAVVLGCVVVVATAVSRLYIGVHFPTDVSASLVYAVSAAAVLLVLWLNLFVPRYRAFRAARAVPVASGD